MDNYGIFFIENKLKNKLMLIYEDETFRNNNIIEILKILSENFKGALDEATKLTCLILTLPSTSVEVERDFSCLFKIKNYLSSTMTQERLNHTSMISIEKEKLLEFKKEEIFMILSLKNLI